MTEAEALARAWAVVREIDLERDLYELLSIRLFLAAEVCDDSIVREALGLPEPADTWHVKFKVCAESRGSGVYRWLNAILVAINDHTGEPTLHQHLAKAIEQCPRPSPGVCPKCSDPITTEPEGRGGWNGVKANGKMAGGPILQTFCRKCGSSLLAYEDVYDEDGEVGGNYQFDVTRLCWDFDKPGSVLEE